MNKNENKNEQDYQQAKKMAEYMARMIWRWVERQHWKENTEMIALLSSIGQEAVVYAYGATIGYKLFNDAFESEATFWGERPV